MPKTFRFFPIRCVNRELKNKHIMHKKYIVHANYGYTPNTGIKNEECISNVIYIPSTDGCVRFNAKLKKIEKNVNRFETSSDI